MPIGGLDQTYEVVEFPLGIVIALSLAPLISLSMSSGNASLGLLFDGFEVDFELFKLTGLLCSLGSTRSCDLSDGLLGRLLLLYDGLLGGLLLLHDRLLSGLLLLDIDSGSLLLLLKQYFIGSNSLLRQNGSRLPLLLVHSGSMAGLSLSSYVVLGRNRFIGS